MKDEISPFKALDYLRDNAEEYGRCKANVIYLQEFRKSKKSLLMNQSDLKTESAKESYAYAHEEYQASPGNQVGGRGIRGYEMDDDRGPVKSFCLADFRSDCTNRNEGF